MFEIFESKVKVLNELKEDLNTMKGYLNKIKGYQYKEAYIQILKIAQKADSLVSFKYSLITSRMENARGCLSPRVLETLVLYAESVIKMVEDTLQVEMVKEYVTSANSYSGSQAA